MSDKPRARNWLCPDISGPPSPGIEAELHRAPPLTEERIRRILAAAGVDVTPPR